MSEPAPSGRGTNGRRFESLDVFRGLAILGMAFSGMVPYHSLPAWMYHAQLPPPTRDYHPEIFGLTWVDLVFPFFLFAMGAAIPFALGSRADRGESKGSIFRGLLSRGLALAVYALVGQHLRPFVLADAPGTWEWLVALAGFVLISLILLRWPPNVPTRWRFAGTALGWIGAAIVILFWNYPDDTRGFANYRNDVILMVLANVAVSGGAIWLWTRNRAMLRWVAFACVAAIFLTNELPGLGKAIWDWDPTNYLPLKNGPYGRFLPILYHFEYHKYLLIVLPGTFVGDMVRRALPLESSAMESRWQRTAVLGVGPIACLVACAGLMARQTGWVALLLGANLVVALQATANTEVGKLRLANELLLFASGMLAIGLLCEPIGGGIRKDSPTLSYFLVTSGLSACVLASLSLVQPLGFGDRIWRIVRDTGTNPILGYLVITNLVWGLVGLTGLEDGLNALTQDPWLLTSWALVKTVFVAGVTAWFTRRKLFLRA